MEKYKKSKQHDEIFDKLKLAVIDYSKSTHNWDNKAEDSLVSLFIIEDCCIKADFTIFVNSSCSNLFSRWHMLVRKELWIYSG